MSDTPLSYQLQTLSSAILHWQSALLNILQGPAGEPGQQHPDGAIGGPAINGYRLLIAPASRRGEALRYGLNGLATALPELASDSPDPHSGWHNSNQLLSEHFASNDGVCCGPQAVLYCRTLGPDWYLPSREELQAILAMAALLDAADSSTGSLTFAAMASGHLWSSSSHNLHNSWALPASGGPPVSHNRSSAHYVLPVRRVAL